MRKKKKEEKDFRKKRDKTEFPVTITPFNLDGKREEEGHREGCSYLGGSLLERGGKKGGGDEKDFPCSIPRKARGFSLFFFSHIRPKQKKKEGSVGKKESV